VILNDAGNKKIGSKENQRFRRGAILKCLNSGMGIKAAARLFETSPGAIRRIRDRGEL
jgi:hypothetical protein